ncbi:hypothetical protein QG37_02090 [Candidozyma auris]|uniref:Uncharacterized protein n=1 Tax=Candidozyma auris TaxID=498019 RepID=A0A0L0P4P0_CANAR|nr:hypothetical protein QG37_02090 [[Candida] auris]
MDRKRNEQYQGIQQPRLVSSFEHNEIISDLLIMKFYAYFLLLCFFAYAIESQFIVVV